MRKRIVRFCVIINILTILAFPCEAEAADEAVFHVQTADVQDDGTMTVTVYMTDTENLGGVDAELIYDPSQVTYISSELGEGFTDGIGETNHLAETSAVKCVVIYPEAKTAHGELMRAVFKLNGAASCQPRFQVIDLVDGSLDILPIPYTITYQQADGSWTDMPDTSGGIADKSVIEEAKKLYGVSGAAGAEPEKEENKDENEADTETEEPKEQTESGEKEDLKETESKQASGEGKKNEKNGLLFLSVFVIGGVTVMAVIVTIIYRNSKRKNGR